MKQYKNIRIEYEDYILQPSVSSEDITIINDGKESNISDVIKELTTKIKEMTKLIEVARNEYDKPTLFTGDLNTLAKKGRYYVSSESTNLPAPKVGFFVDVNVADLVDEDKKAKHKFQVAYKMRGDKEVYSRNQYAGVWEEWKRIDALNKADEKHTHTDYASKKEVEDLKQYGDEVNSKLVGALISKDVSASTADNITTNVTKVNDIKVAKGNARPEHVLATKVYSSSQGTNLTGKMKNWGAHYRTVTKEGYIEPIPEGYHSGEGSVTVKIDNLKASNIRSGVEVGGVKGTYRFMASKKNIKSIDSPRFSLINQTDDGNREYESNEITSEGLKDGDIVIMSGEKADYSQGKMNVVCIGFLKGYGDEFGIVDEVIGLGDFYNIYIGKKGTTYTDSGREKAEIKSISFYREV